ncbi:hypothetical protein [Microbacterium kyungheense]|uniref:Uncharacterized protein n=1 Tax=Microbacterium kyungheense TaxID=1263636 RepID=A0A543F292_9MICO|nr:hypothetical protein [Microbacterium kyungheense]TQM27931.1 hypothetical protein FB391_1966 [Microbacterium kyungheense]
MPANRLLGTVAVLALSALALTACAGSPEANPDPTTSSVPTTAAPEPSASAAPEPTADAAPTCETLISDSLVADYEKIGVTAQESPFYIAGQAIEGGLRCMWANFDQPAGDSGQIYGWAKMSDADADAAQQALLAEGWVREDAADGGVYITESHDTAIVTDDEGYGMTYLFAAGQVTVADTKQGLLLIEWPKA